MRSERREDDRSPTGTDPGLEQVRRTWNRLKLLGPLRGSRVRCRRPGSHEKRIAPERRVPLPLLVPVVGSRRTRAHACRSGRCPALSTIATATSRAAPTGDRSRLELRPQVVTPVIEPRVDAGEGVVAEGLRQLTSANRKARHEAVRPTSPEKASDAPCTSRRCARGPWRQPRRARRDRRPTST